MSVVTAHFFPQNLELHSLTLFLHLIKGIFINPKRVEKASFYRLYKFFAKLQSICKAEKNGNGIKSEDMKM